MDSQAARIKETVPGATVIRSGAGIIVKFNSGILFDADKTSIKPDAQANLQNLAASLQKNNATNLLIIGHTDDKEGAARSEVDLSLRRAQAVKAYLVNNGIDSTRMVTMGKGETEPIADNKTANGRAQNRRVELVILASDVMKKQAEKAAN
jgi:outer membrane protein OmpA-like peptidoglycan-associated protein